MKKFFLLVVLFLFSHIVVAQKGADAKSTTTIVPANNPTADAIANVVVADWLAGKLPSKAAVKTDSISGQLEFLERNLLFTSPPKNGRVNLSLRKLVGANEQRRVYQYPLASNDEDSLASVTLQKKNGVWSVRGVRQAINVQLIPDWVFGSLGGIVFAAMTALMAYGVFASTAWRRWLQEAWAIARQHQGIYLATNIVLYGLFAFGAALGFAVPQLVALLQEYTASALSQGGLSKLAQASVPSAAFGIALNNLRAGVLLTSFIPGAMFALPAYVINASLAVFYGMALSPAAVPGASFVLHLPTIFLEFQAYWFVVAASGVMAFRVLSRQRVPFALAIKDYAKSLTVCLLFLVVAAWYEAFEVLVLIPILAR